MPPENEPMPTREPTHETIAHIWIASVVRNPPKQSSIVIPDIITWLPCSCTREPGWEGEVNNRWRATIIDRTTMIHRECRNLIWQKDLP